MSVVGATFLALATLSALALVVIPIVEDEPLPRLVVAFGALGVNGALGYMLYFRYPNRVLRAARPLDGDEVFE